MGGMADACGFGATSNFILEQIQWIYSLGGQAACEGLCDGLCEFGPLQWIGGCLLVELPMLLCMCDKYHLHSDMSLIIINPIRLVRVVRITHLIHQAQRNLFVGCGAFLARPFAHVHCTST